MSTPEQVPQSIRVVSNEAIIAVRAMVGETCDRDMALDIIEVLRPHLEQAWVIRVKQLEEKISALQAKNVAHSI